VIGVPSPLLRVDGVSVEYGASAALHNVSFDLAAGDTLAVVGPNGAGKSSLARALSGLVHPSAGEIALQGVCTNSWTAHRLRRWGLSLLPEGRGVFVSLSVHDNLAMAVRWMDSKAARLDALDRVYEMFPVLKQRRRQRAGTLSGGEQQMLSLARGMAVAPRVLIADELSLGLAPRVVDEVFTQLERIRDAGTAVILIEQFVARALQFSNRILVIAGGSVVFHGSTDDLDQRTLYERYLGSRDDVD
jgi:branched-chain amino acid transport system ATP-binding protein